MADEATAGESAFVHKYSDDQVEQARQQLGREPEGADLAAIHPVPEHGIAGDHPDADDEEGDA